MCSSDLDVLRATLIEYLLLGTLTAMLAAAVGTLSAWGAVTFLMDMKFGYAWIPVLQATAAGVGLVILLGLAGTWTVLGQRPAPVLRAV